MNTPSLAEFKKFSKDVAPAARAVLMARVASDMTRERVDAYITPVFEARSFDYGPLGIRCGLTGRVTSPKDLYLVDDDVLVAEYYDACDAAHRANGFTGPKGHCPALMAESLVIAAENALIDLAEPLFGVDVAALTLENRAKYLELLIGASLKAEGR